MFVARAASHALFALSRRHRRALGGERELACHERILALWPDHVPSIQRAGRLLQERGDPERARALWKRLTELRPLEPEGWAELAWLTLHGGNAGEALRIARLGAKRARATGRLWGPERRLTSLAAELEVAAREEPALRHVVVSGVSHSGSTILSHVLGSLREAGNVGESHWLIDRYRDGRTRLIDFDRDGVEGAPACKHCFAECSIWTPGFRRELAADPAGWYGKLARRMDASLLVSSDKNHSKLICLDPLLRFDAIVLYRDPMAVWSSTRVGSRNRKSVHEFLAAYEREYLRLLNDLPVRGRKLVLDFDRFREAPGSHLERMGAVLGLPLDAELHLRIRSDQHSIGGSVRANRTVRSEVPAIVPQGPIEVPEVERKIVARFTERSGVLRELTRAYYEVFGRAPEDATPKP